MLPVLEFDRVTKEYGGFRRASIRALDEFSLTIDTGEIFGFLGHNGAGKTTAIHIALGFMRPTKGSGRILGKPFGDARTRHRIGFLPESLALYHRPAFKLVRWYGALNRVAEPALSQRTRELLKTLDLEGEAERDVSKFSRGMQQRIGLAQAFVNDPELVLLDEPTSALDPLGRIAVRELLLQARSQGKSVFLSSHLLSEVEMICDRVAIVKEGRVARMGRTLELLESTEECEIVARGIPDTMFGGAKLLNGRVRFIIPAGEQRRAIERIWTQGGEVISINPRRRTLEDIFLELTAGAKPASDPQLPERAP